MKTDIATEQETRPAPVITSEDRVLHFYWTQPDGIFRPGDPSACGLVVWKRGPLLGSKRVPSNPCSICQEIYERGVL